MQSLDDKPGLDKLMPMNELGWLWVPPDEVVKPPVVTRIQDLPLDQLRWDNFQRLCARLAARGGAIEYCQEYGLPGQDQGGIDLYVRRQEFIKYSVWQCKKYQRFTPSLLAKAVTEFLEGEWLTKADEFVVCVTVATEDRSLVAEIEKQAKRLASRRITFRVLGLTQLSERLKEHPDLVDDFFGRPWVTQLCGSSVTERLTGRLLSPQEISRLRSLLRHCYSSHIEAVDPGLPSVSATIDAIPRSFPLQYRFIVPDVVERRESYIPTSRTPKDSEGIEGEPDPRKFDRLLKSSSELRTNSISWLSRSSQSVILGDPGAGKSSLLRYLALDLLSDKPKHTDIAVKWGGYLPLWIPFAMWTRMLECSESGTSLRDLLHAWFRKVCAPEDLISLIDQAIADSRLLLLVDGLDEWTNETAARTAISLLDQFVIERGVPAIATSRPLGFERLGGLSGRWQRAKLAGLNFEQQTEFAARWFAFRIQKTQTLQQDVIEAEAGHKASGLISDVQRDGRLAKIAEVPLLLSGLIALSVQSLGLPRSRFMAYEELVRVLLIEQPRRREKAAHARQAATRISQATWERALAHLAFDLHRAPGSESIDRTAARNSLIDFFVSFQNKPASDATELAEQLLDVGSGTFGILVEKGAQEYGFPHRAFQEFLAARHISNLPFGDQKQIVRDVLIKHNWHDVLLCLCYLNKRSNEVDEIISEIRSYSGSIEEMFDISTFLAQVVFDDLHCSPSLAAEIAEESFRKIEFETWMPFRERLLKIVIGGLQSDVLRSRVEEKICQWFPATHRFLGSTFDALTKWSDQSGVAEALIQGMSDDNENNQRSAGEQVANLLGGVSSAEKRIIDLIADPPSPSVLASALHSLCIGWPDRVGLPDLLCKARHSIDWGVRLVAIKHRVVRGEHDLDDRESLLAFAKSGGYDSGYYWQDTVAPSLVEGWPGDQEIKQAAIRSIQNAFHDPLHMDRGIAGSILMMGFSGDDDVAKAIADLFRTQDYPQHSLGLHMNWRPLIDSFKGHIALCDAVDGWMEKAKQRDFDLQLALLSRSNRAKRLLLARSETTGLIDRHQALWLLEGWGLEDEEARDAILELANSSIGHTIAHLIPDIIQDNALAKKKLIGFLRKGSSISSVMAGLSKIGFNSNDPEIVAAAEAFISRATVGSPYWTYPAIVSLPELDVVKALALSQIHDINGELGAVARAYGNNPKFRNNVLVKLKALPKELRRVLAEELGKIAPEDDFAYQLLGGFRREYDGEIATIAAISFASAVKSRGDSEDSAIAAFKVGMDTVGPFYPEARLAALAGLIELDRLDVLEENEDGVDRKQRLALISRSHANRPFIALLSRHLTRIENAFGPDFFEVLEMSNEELSEVVDQTGTFKNPELLINRMKKWCGLTNSAPALRVLAKQVDRRDELMRICVSIVGSFAISDWYRIEQGITAAEILAQEFGGNPSVLEAIKRGLASAPNPSAALLAISMGWPEDQSPWTYYSTTTDFKRNTIIIRPVRNELSSRFDKPPQFIEGIVREMSLMSGSIWDFIPSFVRYVSRRFLTDGDVRKQAMLALRGSSSLVEKANLSQFLADTDLVDVQGWCREELQRTYACGGVADLSFDVFQGRIRPLRHVLLDLLERNSISA